MCVLLRRLAYPNRLSDLVKLFNRDVTALSRIANWMTKFISERHGHLIRTLDHTWMTIRDLEMFCKV